MKSAKRRQKQTNNQMIQRFCSCGHLVHKIYFPFERYVMPQVKVYCMIISEKHLFKQYGLKNGKRDKGLSLTTLEISKKYFESKFSHVLANQKYTFKVSMS